MIRKTLFATALAGTMALTSVVATPAVAAPDAEDFAKTVLGIVILGAIANAASDQKDRRDDVGRGSERPHDGRWSDRDRNRNRWLPARCEFETRTRRGWTEVFGERCLRREGVRVNSLPDRCEFEIRSRHGERGERTVFGKDCLEDRGYRVEARRRR